MYSSTVVLYQVSKEVQTLLGSGLPANISLHTTTDIDSLCLETQKTANPAEALVLGIGANEPVSIAQRVHSYGQDIPVVILSETERYAQLKQALQFSPFLGGEVQSWSLDQLPALPNTLAEIVRRTRNRRQYTGTIRAAQRHMEHMVRTPPPLTHYIDRLIDRAPVGILNVDANGTILNINRGACEALKIAERAAVGSPVLDLFPSYERSQLEELMAGCVAPLKKPRAKIIAVEPDNAEQHFVEVTASSLIDGAGMLGCTILLQDVTARVWAESEREQAEADLRKSESQLRLITDALPILISYVDPDHRYCFNNKAYEDWFGDPRFELSGRHISETIGTAAYESLKPHLDEALSGQPVDFELRLPYAGRGQRYVRGHMTPDFATTGKVQGVVTTVSDITDSKHAEERARQHLQELAHVSRVAMLGELSSQLAHELAQPLTAIANFTEASLRNLNNDDVNVEEVMESLTDIAATTDRAREIIGQLRSFIQRKELQRVPENVNDLVTDVLRLERTETRWHDLELELKLDPSLPMILADKTLIEQVILNLVRNAIESLIARKNGPNLLKIQTKLVSNSVQVLISDTGPGLTDDTMKQIFEPFFTTKHSGLGMGLAISRSIVDAHGGRLWVENHNPRGATFIFTLAVHTGEH